MHTLLQVILFIIGGGGLVASLNACWLVTVGDKQLKHNSESIKYFLHVLDKKLTYKKKKKYMHAKHIV